MTSRTWLAGVVGAIVMFLWLFVAHMVLGLGEAGFQQIPNEAPILESLKAAQLPHGTYIFPHMDPKGGASNFSKLETGPSGMMIYYPSRHFSFGASLVTEFLTELFMVLIALYLLTLTRINTVSGRISLFALVGLCVACATNIQFWNWYGFSSTNTLASCFTGWMGYILAGAVAAGFKVGGKATAA